jgi:hypothetical protein
MQKIIYLHIIKCELSDREPLGDREPISEPISDPLKHVAKQRAVGFWDGIHSLLQMKTQWVRGATPGIDVKVKLHNNKPQWWLIGGNNETFMDLLVFAKDGRYHKFIKKLQETYPNFDSFTNPGEFTYTSKGIKLSPHQFCKLFITEPYILDYPELRKKFTDRDFKCPTDQEEALPPRNDRRISSFEKTEINAKHATKMLHDQLKYDQREQSNHKLIMGKLDQVQNLVSRLPKRQDQRQDGVREVGEEVN